MLNRMHSSAMDPAYAGESYDQFLPVPTGIRDAKNTRSLRCSAFQRLGPPARWRSPASSPSRTCIGRCYVIAHHPVSASGSTAANVGSFAEVEADIREAALER